mgnify:CR=1 FL=1
MLQTLLRMLQEGRVYHYGELAQALGVSQEMLEEMLRELARLGYLRDVSGGAAGVHCDAGCGQCPMRGTCAVWVSGHIWALTDKGRQAI